MENYADNVGYTDYPSEHRANQLFARNQVLYFSDAPFLSEHLIHIRNLPHMLAQINLMGAENPEAPYLPLREFIPGGG